MIDLLLLLLKPALKAVEGGSRNPLHIIAALIAWPLDILIAHTTWALIAGWPQKGEWTISDTLERLCTQAHTKQKLFITISQEINRNSPTGNHIKAVQNDP